MSLRYFEGPAGSGKTFNLFSSLKSQLDSCPLHEGEAVLAITFMHGSRRRLHAQLIKFPRLNGRFLACTIDSLARRIVCRWKTLSMSIAPSLDLSDVGNYDQICETAATLLERGFVASWISKRYPVVIADELQDCSAQRLKLVQALERVSHIIAAADEFQDLRSTGPNEAVAWLRSSPDSGVMLTGNQRTKVTSLLDAANELRLSRNCSQALGKKLLGAMNKHVAAAHAARSLKFNTSKGVAILTPTRPDKSPFVRDVVARLTEKPVVGKAIEDGIGPFRIVWEISVEDQYDSMLASVDCSDEGISIKDLRSNCKPQDAKLADLLQWAERKQRLTGLEHFTKAEVESAVDRVLQNRRAFLPSPQGVGIRAMTINQAKNREFEGVIVLWPAAIGGDIDSKRRSLYNALTRAKKWAVVIVQDSTKGVSPLTVPPFSRTTD